MRRPPFVFRPMSVSLAPPPNTPDVHPTTFEPPSPMLPTKRPLREKRNTVVPKIAPSIIELALEKKPVPGSAPTKEIPGAETVPDGTKSVPSFVRYDKG